MLIGYARVSSVGQSLELQIEKLREHGCEKIFEEKLTGTNKERPELKRAIDYVREGDIFIVTYADRCSRSVLDLNLIVNQLEAKDVRFKTLNQDFDTTTISGRLIMNVLASVAEFENGLRKERQQDGINRALKNGVKFGKKEIVMTDAEIIHAMELKDNGMTSADVAKKYKMSRSSLLKKIKLYKDKQEVVI